MDPVRHRLLCYWFVCMALVLDGNETFRRRQARCWSLHGQDAVLGQRRSDVVDVHTFRQRVLTDVHMTPHVAGLALFLMLCMHLSTIHTSCLSA